MALTINGKKVLGYALGENKYLSGNGAENLNAFYIDGSSNGDRSHQSFAIDMTKYFNQADAKYSDVQYYQIVFKLFYENYTGGRSITLLTPLLKRGEINNKRSQNAGNLGTITVWFTDNTTLAVRIKSDYDNYDSYTYTNLAFMVYGFTSHDVGSVS